MPQYLRVLRGDIDSRVQGIGGAEEGWGGGNLEATDAGGGGGVHAEVGAVDEK